MFSSINIDHLITLFVMINPLGVLSSFMNITAQYSDNQRKTILRQSTLFSFVLLTLMIFIGRPLLGALDLSTYALQIAGGILFFKFGYDTINGKEEQILNPDDSPSFVPLGFPIIAGPGSITAIIIMSSKLTNNMATISIVFAIAINILFTYIVLSYSSSITRTLGKNGTNALIKLTGLLIMTIGVQLIMNGLPL